jgi:O-antigen ligase
VVFLALIAGTTLAVAKLPLLADTNPIVERFSGPQFLVLTVAATTALLLWLIAWMRGEVRPRLTLAHALLVGFLASATLSSVSASVVPLALVGESGRYMGLTTWMFVSTAFFLGSQLITNAARLRAITRLVIVTGAAEATLGLSQVFGVDLLRFSFPDQYGWMLAQGIGTLGNPNHLASVLVIPFVLACAEYALSDTGRWRAASGLSAVVIGLSLVTSATRAAWLGALIGFALLVTVASLKKRINWRQLVVAIAALLCVAILGALVADQAIMSTRFVPPDPTAPAADQLASGRIMLWGQALDVFGADPVIGVGADSLRNAWKAAGLSSGKIGVFTDDPHSLPLLLLTSFGLLGLLLFGGFLLSSLSGPLRRLVPKGAARSTSALRVGAWLISATALLATSLLSVLCIPMVLMLMTALGVVHAPQAAASRAADGVHDAPLPVRASVLILATALGVAGLVASGVPLVHNLRITAASLDIPMSDEAISVLYEADRALPWRYEMMTRRAVRLTDQGLYEVSVADGTPGHGRERLESLLSDVDVRVQRYHADYYAWLTRARTYAIIADGLQDEGLGAQASQVTDEALRRFPNDLELEEVRRFVHAQ